VPDDRNRRPPRDDPRDRDLYRLVGEVMAEVAMTRSMIEEKVRPRLHEIGNGQERHDLRLRKIEGLVEKEIDPLIDEAKARAAQGRLIKWLAGSVGGLVVLVLGLAIWVVETTWDSQYQIREQGRQLDALEVSQVRMAESATSTRDTVTALGEQLRAANQRQDDRWDRVKDALERLEKRGRR
jgi:hypothetical protein